MASFMSAIEDSKEDDIADPSLKAKVEALVMKF